MIVFGFFYNSCIHESAYGLMSLHKTVESAEAAMQKHIEEKKVEHNEYVERQKKHLAKYIKKENINKEGAKSLYESIGKFDDHEAWDVEELEILD